MADQAWPDPDTTREIVAVFRGHGVDGRIWLVPSGADEAIFVVGPEDAASFPEATLTRVLTDTLRRKVWVTSDPGLDARDQTPVRLDLP